MKQKFISLDGLRVYDSEMKAYIQELMQSQAASTIVSRESFLQFPTIGDEAALYVDTGANRLYRWSGADLKYYKVGGGCDEIKIINGNF